VSKYLWKDLNSLQPQKKMLKMIFLAFFPVSSTISLLIFLNTDKIFYIESIV